MAVERKTKDSTVKKINGVVSADCIAHLKIKIMKGYIEWLGIIEQKEQFNKFHMTKESRHF